MQIVLVVVSKVSAGRPQEDWSVTDVRLFASVESADNYAESISANYHCDVYARDFLAECELDVFSFDTAEPSRGDPEDLPESLAAYTRYLASLN